MTERLPNAIESNWQNILGAADGAGGFLRVSHNDDGTLKSAAITTGLAYTPVNKAGDTMSAPLRLKGPIYDVKAYGALGNGSTDDTAAIQSAIAAVVAAGGGTVFFPAATYIVNGTLDLTDIENVHLVGAGGQTFAYTGLGTTGTILKRLSGTGTMIKWEASTAAQSLRGCMIEGMSINGNQLAATCVSLKSLYGGIFRDLDIRQATTACLALNTVDLVGTEDLQFCRFENIEMRVDPTTGKGIVAGSYRSIGTGYVGNVSFNLFSGLVIYTVNGTAIELNDTDTNTFINVLCGSSGTGIGVDIKGSAWADKGHSRSNQFFQLSAGAGGLVSRATALTQPAQDNWVWGYDQLNGAPAPTIESGSRLNYTSLGGAHTYTGGMTLGGGLTVSPTSGTAFGADFNAGTFSIGQIRLKNNSTVYGRNNAGSADVALFTVATTDLLRFESQVRFQNRINLTGGVDFSMDTVTGTRIGINAGGKLSLWAATPIVQPGSTGGIGGITLSNYTPAARTFDRNSYTLDGVADAVCQVVTILKGIGAMA